MPKPICVIYYNQNAFMSGTGMKVSQSDMQEIFEKMLDDYHIICIPSKNSDDKEDFYLEVFQEKDFTVADHGELKKLITGHLSKLKGK